MLGFIILTKKKLEIITETIRQTEYEIAYHNAMSEIVDILKQSDKVYLEPVSVAGDKVVVKNSSFIGIRGRAISATGKKLLAKNNVIKFADTAIEVIVEGNHKE